MVVVWGLWDVRYGWRYMIKYLVVVFYGWFGWGEMGYGDELGVGCFYFYLGGFVFLFLFDLIICFWCGK